MEEKKPDRSLPPGIPEALHPEIGNGAAWESNVHHFLLKTPDPSRMLAEYLSQHPDFSNKTDLSEYTQTIDRTPDAEVVENEEVIKNDSTSGEPEVPAHQEDIRQDSLEGDQDIKEDAKPIKAGKRVRKAAKLVQEQEETQIHPEKEEIMTSEWTLSPYTRWLKNLSGSEYVHPYDDDFALAADPGMTKQGISETFADLLASQGHTRQAIDMYTRLMEKYPEKSSFFAAKIKALQ